MVHYVSCTTGKSISLVSQTTINKYSERFIVAKRGELEEGCGKFIEYFCEGCGETRKIPIGCHKRTCPICGDKWARKNAAFAKELIWLGHRVMLQHKGIRNRVCSVEISWPLQNAIMRDGQVNKKLFRERRDLAEEICRRQGVIGYVLVFHPYRLDEETGDYTKDGEHFQAIGIASWIKPGDIAYDDFGTVFKVMARKISNMNMWKALYYLFEHCAIFPKLHSIVWCGCLFNGRKFNISEEIKQALEDCKPDCHKCGQKMVSKWQWDYQNDCLAFSGDG